MSTRMMKREEVQEVERKSEAPVATPAAKPAVVEGAKGSLLGSIIAFLLLAALIGGGVMWWKKRPQPNAPGAAGSAAGRPAQLPVAVVAGVVGKKDMPIYLDGLGTVQAFNTVTIRARVDGQLQKVAFTEGQDVRVGDLLAEIDPAPFKTQVEQAEAKKAQDEAQLANARVDLKRNAELLAQKIVAPSVYDSAKALVDQFEAAVKADQAAIDSAKVQLAYTTIASPIEGRTGIRLVDQGNIVHANDASGIVVIAQLRPISVVFTLPEQTLAEINRQRASSELAVIALDRDNITVLGQGKLAVIDNQIDTTTGTIKLKATFPNSDLRLWPGQFVNARLHLTTRKDGIIVPASVIQRGPDGTFAFVIKDDMGVQIRPVKVAQIEQGVALINEGLRPGERVVVDGQYKLQPSSRVKPGKSAKADDDESNP